MPLLNDRSLETQIRGKVGIVDRTRLSGALHEWEEHQKRREREKKTAMLDYIFKEYRSEREKEARRSG